MRFRLSFLVFLVIVASTFSVSAWNDILLKAPQTLERPRPSRFSQAAADDFLMRQALLLEGGPDLGFEPLYSGDYWIQVNEDGFKQAGEDESGRYKKRAQAMFLIPFDIDGKTWFYCGIEGVNHAELWRTDGSYSSNPPVLEWSDATDYSAFAYPNKAADYAISWNKSGCEGLYVGTRNEVNGTEILRYYKNGATWEWVKVNESSFGKTYEDNGDTYPTNTHTRAMAIFTSADNDEECLYVGTYNWYSGCEVWRTNGSLKNGGPEMNWEQVSYGGFGDYNETEGKWEDDPDNLCVVDMIVFGGKLYAGAYNWPYDKETQWTSGRVFRFAEDSADPMVWDEVWDGYVGTNDDGEDCYALAARCFAIFDDKLWAGLFHASGDDHYASSTGDSGDWFGQGSVQSGYVNSIVDLIIYDDYLHASTSRKDHRYVFRTSDGTTWEQRSRNSFGDDYNKSIYCFNTFGNDLYAATWNTKTDFATEDGTGCEVWMTTEDATYITLDSFEATARDDGSILLRWATGTELGTAGFHLYRSVSADFDSFEKITPKLIDATGTLEAGGEYAVLDRSVSPGVLYYYFLVEIDVNGKMSAFGPVQARAKIPQPVSFEMYSAIIQMDTFGV